MPIQLNRAQTYGSGKKTTNHHRKAPPGKPAGKRRLRKGARGDLSTLQERLILVGLCVVIVASLALTGWYLLARRDSSVSVASGGVVNPRANAAVFTRSSAPQIPAPSPPRPTGSAPSAVRGAGMMEDTASSEGEGATENGIR